MLWSLFVSFFKIGLMSFGGGYAMVPIIQHEVEANGWLSAAAFAETVSLAGMAPGPMATNCATLVGLKTAGLPGAIASTGGMVLPSLLVVVTIAAFFFKFHRHTWVRASFYGLRPVVTGLILYAALRFGVVEAVSPLWSWHTFGSILIAGGVIVGILKYKMHPAAILALSGLVGIAFFS
ncbi:chromate transporter [Paenibacillus validus]|uniref:Chromate transporter n=1 Tax=Paenibacillus validus TaxID=44253 RepID=A0A7X3CSC1_9BACL|nr:chromate transporter [Paenibacillus validus]MUG71167.1 chromate transporter [Paenibacillus validus]